MDVLYYMNWYPHINWDATDMKDQKCLSIRKWVPNGHWLLCLVVTHWSLGLIFHVLPDNSVAEEEKEHQTSRHCYSGLLQQASLVLTSGWGKAWEYKVLIYFILWKRSWRWLLDIIFCVLVFPGGRAVAPLTGKSQQPANKSMADTSRAWGSLDLEGFFFSKWTGTKSRRLSTWTCVYTLSPGHTGQVLRGMVGRWVNGPVNGCVDGWVGESIGLWAHFGER